MIELLKELCALPGVSGREEAVREYIKERVSRYADEVREDALGNLMLLRRGKRSGPSLMLCAHMDEVGLIVKNITDDGYLRFGCVGGIDRRVLIGQTVLIGEKAVPGVIGVRAFHMLEKEEMKTVPKVASLYIDIGAEDRKSAEELVSPGDYASFGTAPREFGDGFFLAKAIDDRFGCAILMKLIENEPALDTWFVFTAQEEVGTRGAAAAAYALRPDFALVVEATTAADTPSQKGAARVCRLGGGPVIPFMDSGAIYDAGLRARLSGLADGAGISWQTKSVVAGGTDARAIQPSGTGVRTAALSAPVRNIHSPASVAYIRDLREVFSLAEQFMDQAGLP